MPHMPLATLRIFADDLGVDVVGSLIGEVPTKAANKGEILSVSSTGRPVIARTGTWFITTKGRPLGDDPATHLAWVVGLAKQHLAAIRRQFPAVMADLSLLVQDADFAPSDLPNELLKQAVEIGELEIENPDNGLDLFLNADSLACDGRPCLDREPTEASGRGNQQGA